MVRKKILVLVIIILLAAAGGFFYWWQKREVKGSPDDYVIKDTAAGKIVENKRAGLIVKVPEGWEAETMKIKEGFVILHPINSEIERESEKINLPLKSGCIIDTSLIYKKMDFVGIKLDARYTLSALGIKSQEFEEITINNLRSLNRALKNIFDTQKIGPGMGIDIPYKDKVYAFYLYWAPNDKETCIQEFNKFLDTVSIR